MDHKGTSSVLWFDCETTGLDENVNSMISLGAMMFPFDNVDNEPHTIKYTIQNDPEKLIWGDWALAVHKKSGLYSELSAGTVKEKVRHAFQAFLIDNQDPSKKLILAGNSIAFDRRFLKITFPEIEQTLHYRMIDISGMAEVFERIAYIAIPRPDPPHDPIGDLQASIQILKTMLRYIQGK